ncbi:MAG TPA: AMP-binding protein [Acidimicrobiales bacterium]|nr:AMP-binding protein [Acidimicrobiales bacterium]
MTDVVNLASVVDGHADDAVALVDQSGRSLTYGELRRRVAGLRGGLAGLGLGPGDRVAIISANNPTFVTAYLAILGLGAVAVPLNPLSPAPELQRELVSIGARAVLAGPVGAQAVAKLDCAAVPGLEHVVAAGGDQLDGALSLDDLTSSDPVPLVDRQPDDLAILVFTSGTAGAPRAAMLTHGNLLANIGQIRARDGGQTAADVVLGALPMFHIYGLNVVLGVSLAVGSTVVLVDRFDPHSALDTVRGRGVTVIPGVPTMWSAWAALPGATREQFATVRLASSGAAPLDPTVRRTVRDRFGVNVVEGYGLTEASPAVTTGLGVNAPDGSIGVPVPDLQLRLMDATGDDVLIGDPGEVWVRGPNVFAGYWNDAVATEAALTADGWLRTGDVGVVDDDGFLYLVDRAKDLIIVSGFNVFPAEVEEVLDAHPGVRESAVVGVPHPHSGEAVTAYVVPVDGAELDEEELVAYCAQHLARYKCPAKISFVDELPHSLTGKIVRRSLR